MAAAGAGDAAPKVERGDRNLDQRPGSRPERMPGRRRQAVVVVRDGVQAGAVSIAGLAQALEGPPLGYPDREAGGAVALDLDPTDVLEQQARRQDVFAETPRAQLADLVVGVAVAGELVAGPDDLAHQRRVAARHPAEHEERGLDPGRFQQPEHAPRAGLNPRRPSIPPLARDRRRQRPGVQIVLDIDRQGVSDSASARGGTRRSLKPNGRLLEHWCPSSRYPAARPSPSALLLAGVPRAPPRAPRALPAFSRSRRRRPSPAPPFRRPRNRPAAARTRRFRPPDRRLPSRRRPRRGPRAPRARRTAADARATC